MDVRFLLHSLGRVIAQENIYVIVMCVIGSLMYILPFIVCWSMVYNAWRCIGRYLREITVIHIKTYFSDQNSKGMKYKLPIPVYICVK